MTFHFDVPTGFYVEGNFQLYDTNRITDNLTFDGNLFMENKLGGDHELRFGIDYFSNHTMTDNYYPNMRGLVYSNELNANYGIEGITFPDTLLAITNGPTDTTTFRLSGYLSDTVTFKKLVV